MSCENTFRDVCDVSVNEVATKTVYLVKNQDLQSFNKRKDVAIKCRISCNYYY